MIIVLSSRLSEYFGINLLPQLLMEDTTCKGICRTIKNLLKLPDKKPLKSQGIPFTLVKLKEGKADGPILFLIHPAGGTVYIYSDLLKYLPSDLAVYGLQSQGLDRRAILIKVFSKWLLIIYRQSNQFKVEAHIY